MWIDFNPAWISNYLYPKMLGEITYPIPNLNAAAIGVREWIYNSLPRFQGFWLLIYAMIKVNSC